MFDKLDKADLLWPVYRWAQDVDPHSVRLHRHLLGVGPRLTEAQRADFAQRVDLGRIFCTPVTPTRRSSRSVSSYLARNALHNALVHQNLKAYAANPSMTPSYITPTGGSRSNRRHN